MKYVRFNILSVFVFLFLSMWTHISSMLYSKDTMRERRSKNRLAFDFFADPGFSSKESFELTFNSEITIAVSSIIIIIIDVVLVVVVAVVIAAAFTVYMRRFCEFLFLLRSLIRSYFFLPFAMCACLCMWRSFFLVFLLLFLFTCSLSYFLSFSLSNRMRVRW